MIIRDLDTNHDWLFGQGKSNFLSGEPAIALNIETRILSWLNDCFFDLGAGIDWLNVLGSKGQENMLNINLRRIILQSYGVTGIVNLYITLNENRQFMASYTINTIYSQNYQNTLTQDLGANIG